MTILPGDEVYWLYTQPGGYRFQWWIPAVVVGIGAKRVTIDAALMKGGTKRVTVKARNLRSAKEEWRAAWAMMMCEG